MLNENQDNPSSTSRSSALAHLPQSFAALTIGICIGMMVIWLLVYRSESHINKIENAFEIILSIIVGFGLALSVGLLISWWFFFRAFPKTIGSLNEVAGHISAAGQSVVKKDIAIAIERLEKAAQEGIAWYGPMMMRRWIVQTSIALVVGFGGLIGTALLFKQTILLGDQNKKIQEQTSLLKQQNEKIDLQTITAEAQRKQTIATELASVMQAVTGEVAPALADARRDRNKINTLYLSASVASRVTTFSRSATSYWTIEVFRPPRADPVPYISSRPRSPERGQLLAGLVAAHVWVPRQTIFAEADLRDAVLNNADLSHIDFTRADFHRSNIEEVTFLGAKLASAKFSSTKLVNVDFTGAILTGASFEGALLGNSKFVSATIIGVNFDDGIASGADFESAIVGVVDENSDEIHPSIRGLSDKWEIKRVEKHYRLFRKPEK